jgi:uncharacterized membrane protein
MMAVDQRTFGEKVSDCVTCFGGSWKFIISFTVVMIFWVVLNALSVCEVIAWDKYPFILMNLVLSFVAAFQAPFIMMSQNRTEAKQDEAYRQLFYEIKEMVQMDINASQDNKQDIFELKSELNIIKRMVEKRL